MQTVYQRFVSKNFHSADLEQDYPNPRDRMRAIAKLWKYSEQAHFGSQAASPKSLSKSMSSPKFGIESRSRSRSLKSGSLRNISSSSASARRILNIDKITEQEIAKLISKERSSCDEALSELADDCSTRLSKTLMNTKRCKDQLNGMQDALDISGTKGLMLLKQNNELRASIEALRKEPSRKSSSPKAKVDTKIVQELERRLYKAVMEKENYASLLNENQEEYERLLTEHIKTQDKLKRLEKNDRSRS